ncbi:MAG: glutathione S-transferase family protein [Gammaproteobacteria bacterium]|nr:glutathione S-transferase family protein [Gammaproteobacteria bacterium]
MLNILGRKNSSNVQKVLWCCAELGLDFEREDVGGQFGRNHDPEYLALNPNGLVPTVIDDGFVLWESNTIVRYLAAKHGDETFYPANAQTRAKGERWMDWQLSVVAPAIWPVFSGLVRTPPEERDHAVIANARDKLADVMKILDDALAGTDYVTGPSLSVGDIPVGIMTYRWFTLDMKRERMPNLERWYERLTQRSGFEQHVMIGLS